MEYKMIKKILEALETARHELTTVHGLVAADGATPNETWVIDTSETISDIDEAIELANGAEAIRIGVTPMSMKICAGHVTKDGLWPDRQDVTEEAIASVCDYIVSFRNGVVRFNYKEQYFILKAELLSDAVQYQGKND